MEKKQTASNVVSWDIRWRDRLEWQKTKNIEDAPEFFDDLIARLADGSPETYAVTIQPLDNNGVRGVSLRVISVTNPDQDLILIATSNTEGDWQNLVDRVRKHFHRQIFERLAEALRIELEMETNPELQIIGPARTRFRDEMARHFASTLTHQLGVKKPGRTAGTDLEARRSLIEEYYRCMEAIRSDVAPEKIKNQYRRGHQDPWKVALKWAASKLGLKSKQGRSYTQNYLEKIFTKAKKENPDLVKSKE